MTLALIDWHLNWWTVLAAVFFVLAMLSLPSVLLKRQGRPQSALSWVLILFLLPVVGLFLWWAVGRQHLRRQRRKRQKSTQEVSEQLTEAQVALPTPSESAWEMLSIKNLPDEALEWFYPPTVKNHAQLLHNAEQAYPAIEKMIADAEHHIHLLFYIWNPDETGTRFRDLLIKKAQDGVEVRLLLDGLGSSRACGSFMDALRAAGGEVEVFMPTRLFQRRLDLNFRNHRKLVVVDDRVSVLGGLNIGDEYRGEWRDTAVQLQGPVVDQLQEVFADDWHFAKGADFASPRYFGQWKEQLPGEETTCSVIASGPHTDLNLTHEAFFVMINQATERVWLTTPYFIPDQTIVAALRTAVFRGVDVRVLLPEESDSKLVRLASQSYYPELLQSGMRIFEYGKGILHSKTAVFDNELSLVGSANMDNRSFRLNFELSCITQCEDLNRQMAQIYQDDLEQSREITLSAFEERSYFKQVLSALAHLLSPLL